MKSNLIAISGKANSGKDTVGKIIQYLTDTKTNFPDTYTVETKINNYGPHVNSILTYQIKKFADKLKDIVCLLIGCTKEQLEDREFKEKELGEEWNIWECIGYHEERFIALTKEKAEAPQGGYYTANLIKLTPRKLLQLLGTECGREIIHPNIWCNSLFSDYYGDIEEWKDINNYEGLYQVSSFGNIRSLDREVVYGDKSKGEYHNRKGQLLKPTLSGGYKTVSLSGKTFTVHSLVGEHFLDKPYGDFVLNHKDYNKENNFYKNLEYVTQGDNVRHNYVAGNANIGVKQKDAKLNKKQVIEIKRLLETDISQNKIAKQFNVSPTTITDIKKGRKWKHIGKNLKNIEPIVPINPPNWIITDVRFPNEAKVIKDKGGILIRVNRPYTHFSNPTDYANFILSQNPALVTKYPNDKITKENLKDEYLEEWRDAFNQWQKPSEHESETSLDDYKDWDFVVDNNGTVEDLVEKVKQLNLC